MNGTTTAEAPASALEINTALADLRIAGESVGNKEWLSGDLAGEPPVSLSMLGSTASPLSALASAGCDFLTPVISFLEEPLGQLRGEPDSVSGPAGQHQQAAQGATTVADDYGSTAANETSEWSGEGKQNYTETVTKLIDGIKTVAEAAATNAKAITAAGEVVAQVVDIVTRLITEAVGKIVPIMTEAIAAAPATFGASIAQAIPQCVAIAVDYGGQIAGKLAALLSSGENLVKLIEGAVGVLDVAKEGLSVIGDLAGGASGETGESSSASGDKSEKDSDDSGSSKEDRPEETEETEETGESEETVRNPLDGEWTRVREEQS
ncbi:hypothetical protein [Amycolatopsis albispora]|uniref:ESX-1 secretion-associated protein EspA/EspE-like domain-containing protein n=1 Tax=Amycolatopsis albispora TaxID=1804986 RepID=A0A344KZW9_9PSEU|nr:hypothetical protein [Amycolatopsis albispora]AXB41343.1 hypothetical protein A4R43_01410 [Amycolatopsis albispora]